MFYFTYDMDKKTISPSQLKILQGLKFARVLCVSLHGQQAVNGTNLSLLLFLEAH